jgi:hypothetical protein
MTNLSCGGEDYSFHPFKVLRVELGHVDHDPNTLATVDLGLDEWRCEGILVKRNFDDSLYTSFSGRSWTHRGHPTKQPDDDELVFNFATIAEEAYLLECRKLGESNAATEAPSVLPPAEIREVTIILAGPEYVSRRVLGWASVLINGVWIHGIVIRQMSDRDQICVTWPTRRGHPTASFEQPEPYRAVEVAVGEAYRKARSRVGGEPPPNSAWNLLRRGTDERCRVVAQQIQ